jgi:cyclophilin family peptidyl-prolyl cis-trans isomerase
MSEKNVWIANTVAKVWGPVLLTSMLFACFGHQAVAKDRREAVAKNLHEIDGQLARVKLLEQTRRKELSVWRPFLQSKHPGVRLAGLRAVGQAGTASARSILRSAVNEQDPAVQETALFSLIQLEELDTSVLEAIIANSSDSTAQARRIRFIGLAMEPVSQEVVAQLLTNKADAVRLSLIRALRQRQILFQNQPALITGDQIAILFEKGTRLIKMTALRYLRSSELAAGPWQKRVIELCAVQTDTGVLDECALTQDRLGNAQAELKMPAASQLGWSTQVALARARAIRKDTAGLVAQIDASLAGIKDGSLPLETASFYGVIAPIEVSIGMDKDPTLKRAGQAAYDAIVLDGVSVNDATGGLGLSLSHLHCAAAALVDRNLEKVKLTKTCGASDYNKALRDMWKIRAIMNWSPKRRDRWLKRRFTSIAPRAQILALELAEDGDLEHLQFLLEHALSSEVAAVAGSAAKIIGRKQISGLEAEMVSAYRRTIAQREFSVVEAVIAALAHLSYETAEVLFTRHREDPHSGIREAALMGLVAIEERRLKHNDIDRLETMQLGRRSFEPPPAALIGSAEVDRGLFAPPVLTRYSVRTTKGTFEMELRPEWGLLASKKLAMLAERRFFDGQTVTVQRDGDLIVGDPSGLGWDGKGRNVPDEMTPEEITAGSVILHRSGRDTATSRLLITRVDRPDLFGRVNLVGRVVKGAEGLNAVVEGDRIVKITAAPSRPSK